MGKVYPLLPRLTVNRQFMGAFLSADAPCFALGMVEERKRRCGFLSCHCAPKRRSRLT